jgi:hypothetical protein
MSPSHSILRAEVMRELIVQGVSGDALRAALVIVEQSYGADLDAAPFAEQRTLALILGWTEEQCSRAVKELRDRKIAQVFRHAGAWWYELRPCGRWLPADEKFRKTRVPAERIAAARTAWKLALETSRRDPDQQDLIKWSPDEMMDGGYAARLLAESRHDAVERAERDEGRVNGPLTQPENEQPVNGPLSRPVNGPLTGGGPHSRGRVRACEHVHVPTSVPQSMVHDHDHAPSAGGEENGALRALSNDELESLLDGEGRHWLEQLSDIVGDGEGKFRRTWLLRFCDRWKQEAFSAIGETKRMKVQGERFTKGPGPCANDLFHRFKHTHKKP